MTSLNIFDVFGRQKITLDQNNIDGKLNNLKREFSDGAKKMFENLKDHIKKTEELLNSISVSKNYISLNRKKRIVGVKPAIDKNDVIIKDQFEKLETEIYSLLSNLNTTIKDIDNKIKNIETDYNNFKSETQTKLYEIYSKRSIFESVLDNIKMINTRLTNLETHKK